jgi:hypothetical protein
MQGDSTAETGWSFVADTDELATIISTVLTLDEDEIVSRSELASNADIALKTLHLSDDIEHLVELGVLEKHDAEGEEVSFSVNPDSDVLRTARQFGEAVATARSE